MAKRPTKTSKVRDERGLQAVGDTGDVLVLDGNLPRSKRSSKKPPRDVTPVPIDLSLSGRVSRGARWLDVVRTGWFKRMPQRTEDTWSENEGRTVRTLSPLVDLQSVGACPLSVAFGRTIGREFIPSFAEGVRTLCNPRSYQARESRLDAHASLYRSRPTVSYVGSDTSLLASYGFAAVLDGSDSDPYVTLNQAWEEEIRRRIAEVPC